jgi:hypothetical protein
MLPAGGVTYPTSRPAGSGDSSSVSQQSDGADQNGSQSFPVAEDKGGRERTQSVEGTQASGLDQSELKLLSRLKSRDREVRAHEAAHQSVGGQYAGSMSFTYQRGPDGAQYAIGGEVPVDVSPVEGNPQATLEKMRIVRAAALAPAQPSGQDRAVAAQAMQTMLEAQSELATQNSGKTEPGTDKAVSAQKTASDPAAESGSESSRQARNVYQDVAGLGESPNGSGASLLPSSLYA